MLCCELHYFTCTSKSNETKWAHMQPEARQWFAEEALKMLRTRSGQVRLYAIVVNKQRIKGNIRQDGNQLYNHILRCHYWMKPANTLNYNCSLNERSVKIQSDNSLHN